MGLRYTVKFKDSKNESYEVRIYREGYTGEPTELVGAPSCFVVSLSDDDFVYTPIRTSSATLRVIDSELLLDLYSINNQYAAVKLYKNGLLEWSGYIKAEQFTQPYVPYPQSISIDCISSISTLENIEYKQKNENGYIHLFELIQYLIESANGGYSGIYMPPVYGEDGNALQNILLAESNFTDGEMNMLEVLEHVCKFLNWTIFDIKGFLFFVDSDWKGEYRLYDGFLDTHTMTRINEVSISDVGYNGSESNTLDIVPGYNKAKVKSINNVFDKVIEEEMFDILEIVQTWTYNGGNKDGARRIIRKFKKPERWVMYYYDHNMNPLTFDEAKELDMNTDVVGCVEMTENSYTVEEQDGQYVPAVKEYTWNDLLKVRLDRYNYVLNAGDDKYKAFTVKGVNSIWKDGAFGVNMQLMYFSDPEFTTVAQTLVDTYLYFMLRIGKNYWNGTSWVENYSLFKIRYNVNTGRGYQPIESNLNADMPYRGLTGHVVELPSDKVLIGDLEFTMFMNDPAAGTISGYIIKGMELDYVKKDGVNTTGQDGDRVYENIVNEAYMSECDEIEFEVGSYNEDGATYSKALLGGDFLTNNLYCAVVDEHIRPEELLIRRIVNRYGETKIKLTEALCMTDEITPISVLKEKTIEEKNFRMTSGEWDYERNRLIIQMQEDV